MADATSLYLKQRLFGDQNSFACGKDQKYKACFSHVYDNFSSSGILCPVPDNCYRPQIYASIDFGHQFTVDLDGKTETTPVLDPDIILAFYRRLLEFSSYYFKYAEYKPKSFLWMGPWVDSLRSDSNKPSLQTQIYFLNYIVNFFLTEVAVSRGRQEVGEATLTMRDSSITHSNGNSFKGTIFTNQVASAFNQLLVPM
ncbi:MAG: hypothetical protein LUQ65_14690, partial [Candidatus Helarchaeota archaeon]|nr:hypothetical protein [Candidatus Helarchaeota archaeon]